MRIDYEGDTPVLVLSERNLLSLLHKLEMKYSVRTLVSPDEDFIVRAETDEEHYVDRLPGEMHPDTEYFIRISQRDPS